MADDEQKGNDRDTETQHRMTFPFQILCRTFQQHTCLHVPSNGPGLMVLGGALSCSPWRPLHQSPVNTLSGAREACSGDAGQWWEMGRTRLPGFLPLLVVHDRWSVATVCAPGKEGVSWPPFTERCATSVTEDQRASETLSGFKALCSLLHVWGSFLGSSVAHGGPPRTQPSQYFSTQSSSLPPFMPDPRELDLHCVTASRCP